MKVTCEQCHSSFVADGGRGRTPKYCSPACKQRAYRSRRRTPSRAFPSPWIKQRRWVCASGKRPIQPNGLPASSTDQATWSGFEDVQSGAGDGLGLMLGGGLGCYDIDHCLTPGGIEPWAAWFLERIQEPVVFVERSVSGTGLHVFVEAVEAPGKKIRARGGLVERYTRQRFIRVTQDLWEV